MEKRQFLSCLENRKFVRKIGFFRLESKISAIGLTTPTDFEPDWRRWRKEIALPRNNQRAVQCANLQRLSSKIYFRLSRAVLSHARNGGRERVS